MAKKRTVKQTALQRRLILLSWLHRQFGYKTTDDMLTDLKDCAEGFDDSGRSYIYRRLESRGGRLKLNLEDLARYDDNIRNHLRAINVDRDKPIVLRYFQHVAALYGEVFLDWRFRRPGELAGALNELATAINHGRAHDDRLPMYDIPKFSKFAYWMATGSGKTLIMHLNYKQFFHYNLEPLDNIVLITPNEGLTNQHIAEMNISRIPCRRFQPDDSGLPGLDLDAVQVIEITKLVEEKSGSGTSVPLEALEGTNLVFVDEGHRGSGGDAWRKVREAVGINGFTFEYSATFGQALGAAGNSELTAEYGKAIGFDYSYRYFHGDGYGKDFRVLNLTKEKEQSTTDMLLLGNLLSFYEQRRVFDEQRLNLRQYNVQAPLWVFVGGTVNAVYSRNKQKRSDVLTVARFLHRVLANRNDWVVKSFDRLLDGDTGLRGPDGRDVFADRFSYLRQSRSRKELYRDVLRRVFHSSDGGGLHLASIRGSPGEIGLKASTGDRYFGVIYIGDTGAFTRLLRQDEARFIFEQDAVGGGSLFEEIANPGGGINLLIGARKFMEGWNSWRVANMGLMNIGRSEGSQIIQLFGRGVRLRGKGYGLKRSSALEGEHPPNVRLLETLNIFAVRADYMFQFRNYLKQDGIDTDDMLEMPLEVKTNRDFLNKGLVVPRVPSGQCFEEEMAMFLRRDENIRVRVDQSARIRAMETSDAGLRDVEAKSGRSRRISSAVFAMIDWQEIYLQLVEYIDDRGWSNLVLPSLTALRQIIDAGEGTDVVYELLAEEHVAEPRSVVERRLLEGAVLAILKKYVDKYRSVRVDRWNTRQMIYAKVSERDANFPRYMVRVPRGDKELVEAVRKLIEDGEDIYRMATADLPGVYFDRHLYQPLLVDRDTRIKTTPLGLNAGEQRFVEDLRTRCEALEFEEGRELFLLRNLTRGTGIGFFQDRGFYPDFILWTKDGPAQRVVFVEPHGMIHAGPHQHDDKARLHERLPALARSAGERSGLENVAMDSYIVSQTPYEELRRVYDDGTWTRDRFARAHILFPECSSKYNYISIILGQQTAPD